MLSTCVKDENRNLRRRVAELEGRVAGLAEELETAVKALADAEEMAAGKTGKTKGAGRRKAGR